MKQIFLLGAYGQNNLGDDALLEVFLEQLCPARLVVNSAQAEATRHRYHVDAIATYARWPHFGLTRALFRTDALVFGGGSLLKEIEGGSLARMAYFMRIFIVLVCGKLLGRPAAMLGVGIGPLGHTPYRWLSRYAANMTDLICVRDRDSRELLRAIGVRRPVYITG